MTRADWLVLGGVLLFALSVASSVPTLARGSVLLGLIHLVVGLAILSLSIYAYKTLSYPPFTIISHHLLVEILDPLGADARIRKTITLRPNHSGLDHYAHRNISSDGTLTFLVDPNVTMVSHQVVGGDHLVYVRFPYHLRRGQHYQTWLEALCKDAFTSNPEFATLLVDQPIKSATIEIVLPPQRPPQTVRAVYRYSGLERELPSPEVHENRIIWQRSTNFVGIPPGEYEVRWTW